ncbi:Alpha/beta hydrolase [Forsythia ovata]|uniref:Alpha/beta hydrolase n=1 Tax=Forsythia ovata TaxID=205694 RepID=A0ABD1XDF2_9LAMI
MKALQDVVPKDFREKLTTVVSRILQSQRSNLKFERLLSLGNIFDVAAGLNSKVLEKSRLSKGGGDDDHSSDQKKRINQLGDGSGKVYSSESQTSLQGFWRNMNKRSGKKARTKSMKNKYSLPVLEQTKLSSDMMVAVKEIKNVDREIQNF